MPSEKSSRSQKKKKSSDSQKKSTKKSAGSLRKKLKSPDSVKSKRVVGSLKKSSTKKSPDSLKKSHDSKSKSKSNSKSNSQSKSKSNSGKSQNSKKSKSKKSNSKKSNRSVGVSGNQKSLSSRKSTYKQSVGRALQQNVINPSPSSPSHSSSASLKWSMYTSLYGQNIYDTVQLIMTCHCGPKKKVALCGVEGSRLYLPFCPVKHGQSWTDAIGLFIQGKLLRESVAKLSPQKAAKFSGSHSHSHSSSTSLSSAHPTPFTSGPKLVELLRVQLPVYLDFVTRATYRLHLTSAACSAKLCAGNSVIGWYSIDEKFTSSLEKKPLYGPEPLLMIRDDGKSVKLKPGDRFREVAVTELFAYQCVEELREVKSGATGTTKDDILRVFGDYLQHVFPSEFMLEASFTSYLKKADLKITSNVSSLFRAFAAKERSFIDFEEFIIGLLIVGRIVGDSGEAEAEANAISEGTNNPPPPPLPTIHHSPATMKVMADFVFRFYATKPVHLNSEQLEQAAKDFHIADSDLAKLKKSTKRDDFTKLLTEKYLPKSNVSVNTQKQVKLFEKIKDRTPLEQLHVRIAYPEIRRVESEFVVNNKTVEQKLQARMLCENCHLKQYHLAPFNMKMSRQGQLYQPTENKEVNVKEAPAVRRTLERNFFEPAFVCNKILDMLRKFAAETHIYPCLQKKLPKGLEPKDWTNRAVRQELVPDIVHICEQARLLIGGGPRVLKVTSPCYVLGDIHGNLTDLLTFDANIWRSNVYFSPSNLLFLGDYVDRGQYSVECILYLLCLKLITPHRVHLLRGNHETREQQREHTFFCEVNNKFGGKLTKKIFEAFNDVFDVMPLVGVIDESIYCSHGGIPSQVRFFITQLLTI